MGSSVDDTDDAWSLQKAVSVSIKWIGDGGLKEEEKLLMIGLILFSSKLKAKSKQALGSTELRLQRLLTTGRILKYHVGTNREAYSLSDAYSLACPAQRR